METISDLQKKEVINVTSGARLGFVYDADIDMESGKIISLRVPVSSKGFNLFAKTEDYIIPWENIKKIGNDMILVTF